MYRRHEAVVLKQEFWTNFGRYMMPVLSSEGEKINWINYRTGEKNIHFRLNADDKEAIISIELSHKDENIRNVYFKQFSQYKILFEEIMKESWAWSSNNERDNKSIGSISRKMGPVNIFNRGEWPKLISFFKPRLIALDEFWNSIKYNFDVVNKMK